MKNKLDKTKFFRVKGIGPADAFSSKPAELKKELYSLVLRPTNYCGEWDEDDFMDYEDAKKAKLLGKTGGMFEIIAPNDVRVTMQVMFATGQTETPAFTLVDVELEELSEEESAQYKDIERLFELEMKEIGTEAEDIQPPLGALEN